MSSSNPNSSGGRGVALTAVCLIAAVAGTAVWLLYALRLDPPHAYRALLVNFIYFAPMACGMVVWPAVVMISQGRWMGAIERTALAGVAMGPVTILMFALLAMGASNWATWLYEPTHNQAWLNWPSFFVRDGGALLAVWVLAWLYVRARKAGKLPGVLAALLVLAYGAAFSLVGFDMVMALDPSWCSALFGGYFFMSGMYAAVAAWTLCSLIAHRPLDSGKKHDLGKLLMAFGLITTYLMYSQLLPIWYADLPHEVSFVLPRLRVTQWSSVSAVLLAVIYLGPLVLLLTTWSKRNAAYLGGVAGLVLCGLWVERWWLVTPATEPALCYTPADAASTVAIAACFVLGLQMARRRLGEISMEDAKRP